MKTYIALFRGINVGGNSILSMKDLVAILEELGAQGVKTHIQSGNAVFSMADENISQLTERIRNKINRQRGFTPQVLLLTPVELKNAMAANPFPDAETDPGHLHLGFLAAVPTQPDFAKLDQLKIGSEEYCLIGRVFYLHAPEGVGRSKLAASCEKCLGVPITDRNWNTVCKLREMATS